MKKITFLAILMSISTSYGQIILNQDFDAALTLPAGWTNNDIAGNDEIWTFETGGLAPAYGDGNTLLYTPGGLSGSYPMFNSDAYGDNGFPENAAVTSPIFDCSTYTNIVVSFNHFILADVGGAGFLEVFNGTSWILIKEYSETTITPNSNGDYVDFGLKTFNISTQLAGVSNAQIRFRWTGDWAYFWAFDNVVVQQPTESAPNTVTTPSPVNGAVNVPIDMSNAPNSLINSFSWVAATTGDAATSFNINLGTNTTGSNIGSLENFSSGDGIVFNWAYNTTYYWSITAVNLGGSTQSAVWSFTTQEDPSLSTAENNIELFSIYPNPIKDIVTININETIDTISIVNQLGQQILKLNKSNIFDSKVDLSSLTKGLYFMTITAESKSQSIKIIKD